MDTNRTVKEFICNECYKSFPKKQSLILHFRSHPKQTPFECIVCNNKFTTKSGLRQHIQTHFWKKNFIKCKVCNKVLISELGLLRHQDYHLRVGMSKPVLPIKCKKCGKGFAEDGLLRAHVCTPRKKKKTFSCGLCEERFMRNKNRRKHMENQHSAKCKPEYVDERNLRADMIIYVCLKGKNCGKEYRTRKGLVRHWRSKH